MFKHNLDYIIILAFILISITPKIIINEEIFNLKVPFFKYESKEQIKIDQTKPKNNVSISKRLNTFGLNLFKAISNDIKIDNFFVSPFSLSIGTLMLYFGARGETAKQLKKLLGLIGLSNEEILQLNRDQIIDLNLNHQYDTFYLKSANKIFLNKSASIPNDYKSLVKEFFNSSIDCVNFLDKIATSNSMNEWIEKETNGRISKLIDPDRLDKYFKMVLANSIYLKALWAYGFEKNDTIEQDFKLINGEIIKAEMMKLNKKILNYFKNPGGLRANALNLWFMMGTASMTIILPEPGADINEIENKLNIDIIHYLMNDHRMYSLINLSLPKFKVESELLLSPFYQKLGAVYPFYKVTADFSGLDSENSSYIGVINHKAFIDVNEVGVEASAATFIGMELNSIIIDDPIEVNCNRPFIYFIHDQKNLIFIGKLLKPIYY